MKLILCLFEQLSGLKINFHKSEIFCFGQAKEQATLYEVLFGCKLGSYPFRYLGLPMHVKKLRNRDWKLIEDRIEKRLGNWKGKLLSYGGRLVLLNSVLSSLPMFMLSFFEIPRGVLEKIEYFRSRFFWQYDSHQRKYGLIRWPLICQPKDQGGLGIQNLDIQNKCLLSKWLFKLCNEDGLWQDLLRNKYIKDKPLAEVEKKARDSHFWKGLMGVKDQFLNLGRFKLVSGNQLRFWKDIWLGNQALKFKYPNLFNIVRKKRATVADVLSSSPLNISFRRGLVGNKLVEWHGLVASLIHVNLEEGTDIFMWGLHKTGSFTVRSMYKALVSNGIKVSQKIWRLKIPLKIKIFLWFLKKEVLLTKDNLVRRNWRGTVTCDFCKQSESIQHLFFDCIYAKFLWRGGSNLAGPLLTGAAAFCWALWLSRNDLTFNKCQSKTFLQVLFRGTHWLRLRDTRTDDMKIDIVRTCRSLESAAMELFASHGWPFMFRIGV
ncbi:LOW QUALITY PROTEIN: hypothetical protein U9M48_029391 [Paspalum notatum var. saurae]|uniref:Reverse transcriptase zinc-binding domain-containing protein n=1 Tax=Paspalum notatum var. saurae TaxID=547442 RepID=A0AAQ3U0V7_PASNO